MLLYFSRYRLRLWFKFVFNDWFQALFSRFKIISEEADAGDGPEDDGGDDGGDEDAG